MTTAADLSPTDCARIIQRHNRTSDPAVAEALAYVINNDLWQDGKAWRGPRPTGDGASAVLEEIRRGLVGANLALELVQRHVAGVAGREPTWTMEALRDDEQEAFTAWWDRINGIAHMRYALTRALCGDHPVVRLRVVAQPDVTPRTLADALSYLDIEVLGSDTAAAFDTPTMLLGIAVFAANTETVSGLLGHALQDTMAEVSALTADGTLVRVLDAASGTVSEMLIPMRTITMYGLTDVAPLVTSSICSLQGRVTSTLTEMGRNCDTGGFVERIIVNGEPANLRTGAGVINWIAGVNDADGNPVPANVLFRDPVSTATFSETVDTLTYAAHKEARQLHALIAGSATASGESRVQAMADFVASLQPTARATERLMRWIIETSIALGYHLMRRQIPADFRVAVTCQLSAGIVTVERLRELREGTAAGLLQPMWYQEACGVTDVEAEQEALRGPAAATE